MPGISIPILIGLLIGTSGLILACWALRRLCGAEASLAAARRAAETRSRQSGLLAQELQGSGLALLGHAGQLAPAQATAIAARAWQLLGLSDDVTEFLAVEAGPRRLRAGAVPLVPLLEES